jgi:HEAT repeat protein
MRCLHVWSLIATMLCCSPAAALVAGQTGPAKEKVQVKEAAFDESAIDEKVLRDARLATDGPSLLKYFRDRTHKQADPKRLALLVDNLGDPKFSVREQAYTELLTLGVTSLEALKQASKHDDEEVRNRAAELRQQIEERADPGIQSATARLIGWRQPEGAAEVLLNYLPQAADDSVMDDICDALAKVAVRSGKVEPSVVACLNDKQAVKRGAAGAAVVAADVKDLLPAAKGLLTDRAALVRLRVAVALVATHDRDGVQPMIDCLRELSAEHTWSAEEYLLRIAGDKAPAVSLGKDEASQADCFRAWDDWWKANAKKIDLANIDYAARPVGFTMVICQNRAVVNKQVKQSTFVCELDRAKNVRWKFDVPIGSMDAFLVGPQRVMVLERASQRVTIRDFRGKIRWEKMVPNNVLSVQRLPNGNLFMVTQNSLTETDANDKVVFNYQRNNPDIYRGRKMANGDVVLITNQGKLSRLDGKTQEERKSFDIGGFLGNLYGTVEELPNGNLLIPIYQRSLVVEFEPTGKEVWKMQIQNPSSAQRLPNGNTLVASQFQGRVMEFDTNHREVWSTTMDGNVFVARMR